MKHYILFQAYGNEGIIAECKFALLKLARSFITENSLPEVVLYTDKPEEFAIFTEVLTLHLIEIDNEQIATWKGKSNFVHRVKIEVISDCLQHFKGKLIYADTDTYCLKSLNPLFDTITSVDVLMHEKEGILNKPQNLHFKKWNQFLQKNPLTTIGELRAINTVMWNAGVIGIQQNHLPLLQAVLDLTDQVYAIFPKHTAEQFAFSYTFQNSEIHIHPAQPFVFHYWNLKEFRSILLDFFKKNQQSSLSQLISASKNLNPAAIVQGKLAYERGGVLIKLFKKMVGKKWTIDAFMPKD